MNKAKLILTLLFVLCMASLSFAVEYDVNETIRIDAIYTEGGVLTNATAGITIESPSGSVLVSNETMNDTSIGVFYYDYLIPDETGTYGITVRFYTNGTISGLKSDSFDVGLPRLQFGVCPSTINLKFLWLFLIICLIAFIGAELLNIPYAGLIISGFIVLGSLYLYPCTFILGVVVSFTGLMMLVYSLFRKTLN